MKKYKISGEKAIGKYIYGYVKTLKDASFYAIEDG